MTRFSSQVRRSTHEDFPTSTWTQHNSFSLTDNYTTPGPPPVSDSSWWTDHQERSERHISFKSYFYISKISWLKLFFHLLKPKCTALALQQAPCLCKSSNQVRSQFWGVFDLPPTLADKRETFPVLQKVFSDVFVFVWLVIRTFYSQPAVFWPFSFTICTEITADCTDFSVLDHELTRFCAFWKEQKTGSFIVSNQPPETTFFLMREGTVMVLLTTFRLNYILVCTIAYTMKMLSVRTNIHYGGFVEFSCKQTKAMFTFSLTHLNRLVLNKTFGFHKSFNLNLFTSLFTC